MTLIYIFFGLLIPFLVAAYFYRNEFSDPPKETTDEDIRKLVAQGHELQALKWYRTIHSGSLSEAKSAIEKMKKDNL